MEQEKIRFASKEDIPRLLGIYSPFVRRGVATFETDVPGAREFNKRLAHAIAWLVYEKNGRILGYAYASRHRERAAYRWSVDVSVYVDSRWHGCGVAKALYVELLRGLKLLGYYNAYAGITLPNAASVRLHESFGFRRIGIYRQVGFKSGAWRDVGWWELFLSEKPRRPAEPRTIGALTKDLPLLKCSAKVRRV